MPGNANAHSTNTSASTDTRLPHASAAPDIDAASRPLRAAYGISELCSTSPYVNSSEITSVSASTAGTPRPWPSGLAHHSANTVGANNAATSASAGLRRPMRSAAAPRKGAVSAAMSPPSSATPAIIAWPLTASPISTVATYGMKT